MRSLISPLSGVRWSGHVQVGKSPSRCTPVCFSNRETACLQAREALFESLDVTGVVNGAELRQRTKVWPEVAAPFCLLFARNRAPAPEAAFRFVSPHPEPSLNDAGTMRIDAISASLVTADQISRRPEILKILFRGGDLDLHLIERIETGRLVTIGDYWERHFGREEGRLRFTGNGYQRLRDSSRTRKTGDGLPGRSAEYLHGLPEILRRHGRGANRH